MHVCVNIWVSSFLFVFHDLLPHWQSFSLCFFPFIFKSFFFMNHQFGFWVVLSKAFWHSDTIASLATVFVMLPLSHRRSSLSGKKKQKNILLSQIFHFLRKLVPSWCLFPEMGRKGETIREGIQNLLSEHLLYYPTETGEKTDKSCSLGAWHGETKLKPKQNHAKPSKLVKIHI